MEQRMQPVVLQLQAECLNSGVPVLEILRKALVIARKLSLTDAQSWIQKELNGFKSGDEAPPYRLLTGQVRAWNPYHGWIPVMFQDSREATYLSKCFVGQPIGELEDLLKHGKDTFLFPFDPQTQGKLMEGLDSPLQPTRHLSRSSISGVIDAVRNMVLEWCLQLEKDGILGEGLVFTAREKETAAHASYTINYNAPVSNSQIQQGSPHAAQSMNVTASELQAVNDFVGTLRQHRSELKLDADTSARLDQEVRSIEQETASASPRREALRESLRTIRNVIEGCAGSLIASGLLFELGKLLK